MSLSNDPAFSMLKSRFVCGTRDISVQAYAGRSGSHATCGQAYLARNGAGPHNVQMFILAPDGTVLHCLPGYWHPQDLAGELRLAQDLWEVWRDPRLTRAQKNERFRVMQTAHIQQHSEAMVSRSQMEGFDKAYEGRVRPQTSDTIRDRRVNARGKIAKDQFKTTDVIVHERMALRPFLNYRDFDVEAFSDYGRPKYDKREDLREADEGKAKHQKYRVSGSK